MKPINNNNKRQAHGRSLGIPLADQRLSFCVLSSTSNYISGHVDNRAQKPFNHRVATSTCPPASQSSYGQSVILIGTLSVVHFFSRLLSNNKHEFNPDDAEDIQGPKLSLQITSKDLCQQHRRLYSHGWTKFDSDRPQTQRHTQLWLPVWGAPSATPASGVGGTTMLQGRHTWLSLSNCLVFLTLWYYLESSN